MSELKRLPKLEYIFTGLFAAGLLFGFVACAEVGFESTIEYSTHEYEMTVPPNQVDILVVVDNSRSMVDEQNKLMQGFSGFLSKLRSFDTKVGVVTTYLSGDSKKDKAVRTGNFYNILSDIRDNETLTTDRQQRYKYGDEKGIDRAVEVIKRITVL